MKKLAITLITIFSLFSANISQAADRYVMLKIDASTPSASQSVGSGEVAFLLWATYVSASNSSTAELFITYGGITKKLGLNLVYPDLSSYVIPGPATITYTRGSGENLMAIKIQPNPNVNGIKQ